MYCLLIQWHLKVYFCFSKIACSQLNSSTLYPQSFSTIEYLYSFQIQSCDSYIPKVSRESTPDPPSWNILCSYVYSTHCMVSVYLPSQALSSLLMSHETAKHTTELYLKPSNTLNLVILYIDEFTHRINFITSSIDV